MAHSLPRFFVQGLKETDQHFILTGEPVHQIARVLRLGVGDALILLDGAGWEYQAAIASLDRETAYCNLSPRQRCQTEPVCQVTLMQALPKGEKFEWILQKATELGVSGIQPFTSSRTIVQLTHEKAERRLTRWQKIAQEAAEQSERGCVPEIFQPGAIARLDFSRFDLTLLLHERGDRQTLPQILANNPKPNRLALIVGPEGGFAPDEVAMLTTKGAIAAGLGPRILRTETAAIGAIAMLMYAYELS